MFYKVKKDDNGKFYVSSESAEENSQWLIECENKAEADTLVSDLAKGIIQTPLRDKSKYEEIGTHINGKTKIYKKKK